MKEIAENDIIIVKIKERESWYGKIWIKLHHFMDIIKLYGAGIEVFVPDETMGHDFNKVANEIVNHPHVQLELTIDGDDICKPCKKYQNVCIDELTQIPGISSKDVYNKLLDTRIIELYQLQKDTITAFELCERFYQTHGNIWQI